MDDYRNSISIYFDKISELFFSLMIFPLYIF